MEITVILFARLEEKGKAFQVSRVKEATGKEYYTIEAMFTGDTHWLVLYKSELKYVLNQFYYMVGTSLTS